MAAAAQKATVPLYLLLDGILRLCAELIVAIKQLIKFPKAKNVVILAQDG